MSVRLQLVQALLANLRTIQVVNGFNTDAGLSAFSGERPTFGPDDPTSALSLSVPSDALSGGPAVNVSTRLGIVVEAYVAAHPEVPAVDPVVALEELIDDVRKALEVADRSYGNLIKQKGIERGPTRQLERDDGSDFVGAACSYSAPIVEGWGG